MMWGMGVDDDRIREKRRYCQKVVDERQRKDVPPDETEGTILSCVVVASHLISDDYHLPAVGSDDFQSTIDKYQVQVSNNQGEL
ncbi:hypothetical protein L1987_20083 [Smallanthus sonchifolius]|uniref:Uncharacterized protein n=1 Tax=Smallanthus sonchifolius TaxID=185202 RepID=A0ACB9ISI3_9ASTR|nr:hypothetical protein L1987_20083 [Smallanthus sonchifolius]